MLWDAYTTSCTLVNLKLHLRDLLGNCESPLVQPPNREIEIGRRLRAWREAKMIPRTKLAIALGIGNERLASYEAGRSALPYSVFRELAVRFELNPNWLATGDYRPDVAGFDDSAFLTAVAPRAKFSHAYDKFINPTIERKNSEAHKKIQDAIDLMAILKSESKRLKKASPEGWARLEKAVQTMADTHLMISGEKRRIQDIEDLIRAESSLDNVPPIEQKFVIAQPETLKDLLQRARRVTSERGKPAQLAKHLQVSRSRVSDWLNGKFEPSGDVILQLSKWVQEREIEQTNSVGSALTPPTPKTQRRSSDETKPTSGRRKK